MMSATDRYASSDGPAPDRPRLLAGIDPAGIVSLAAHRRIYPVPPMPSRRQSAAIIDAIEHSGLRGKGGAAFPTGVKMRTVATGRRTPVVLVNGSEGEPASSKDKVLLSRLPHLVLDGAAIAAAAVGADEVIICVERGAQAAADIVLAALEERRQGELTVPMRLVTIPNRYVAGEETALVHFVNGGEAKPTATPPRPFERGVDARPTLIDNVETLAHVAQIAHFGPAWFRQRGTHDEPGTSLFTLGGAVERPGVREAAIGSSLRQLIASGGGELTERSAVLIGGYYGTWISGTLAASTPLTNAALRPNGSALGCGAVVVLPPDRCGIAETARIMAWMAGESAGQCGPCANGLPALAGALGEVARGTGTFETMARIQRWAGQVDGRGGCRFPDGVVRLLRSALTVFADDVRHHLSGTPCRAATQPSLLRFPATANEPWR